MKTGVIQQEIGRITCADGVAIIYAVVLPFGGSHVHARFEGHDGRRITQFPMSNAEVREFHRCASAAAKAAEELRVEAMWKDVETQRESDEAERN